MSTNDPNNAEAEYEDIIRRLRDRFQNTQEANTPTVPHVEPPAVSSPRIISSPPAPTAQRSATFNFAPLLIIAGAIIACVVFMNIASQAAQSNQANSVQNTYVYPTPTLVAPTPDIATAEQEVMKYYNEPSGSGFRLWEGMYYMQQIYAFQYDALTISSQSDTVYACVNFEFTYGRNGTPAETIQTNFEFQYQGSQWVVVNMAGADTSCSISGES